MKRNDYIYNIWYNDVWVGDVNSADPIGPWALGRLKHRIRITKNNVDVPISDWHGDIKDLVKMLEEFDPTKNNILTDDMFEI